MDLYRDLKMLEDFEVRFHPDMKEDVMMLFPQWVDDVVHKILYDHGLRDAGEPGSYCEDRLCVAIVEIDGRTYHVHCRTADEDDRIEVVRVELVERGEG